MMPQLTAVVAQGPADEVSAASAELARYLEQQSSAIAPTSDDIAGSAEALLPVKEVAIASIPSDSLTITPETLKKFRRGYGEEAAIAADQIKQMAITSAEGILRKARLVLDMKLRLNRKEWGVWLKEMLGWFGNEATQYLQIAKAFCDFEPAVFCDLEPFVILKLRTKRYALVVQALREELALTSQMVQNFIKQLLPKLSSQKASSPISGWKSNRAGGGRRYEVILHDEKTGLSIEQQAEAEAILPQRVIQEAIALRAQHKEGLPQPNEYYRSQIDELHEVVDNARELERENRQLTLELSGAKREISERDRLIDSLQLQMTGRASVPSELSPEGRSCLDAAQESETTQRSVEQSETEATEATDYLESAPEDERLSSVPQKELVEAAAITRMAQDSIPLEAIEEFNATTVTQLPSAEPASSSSTTTVFNDAVALEQVQPACLPEASEGASTASKQLLVADWEVLKQLRDAEGSLRKTDTLIQDLNSQLAQSGSNVVERELRPVLKKQLDLRSTTVNQIVALIDTSRIQAYYEELQNKGRVVLDRKYASTLLHQAQSWSDVVMVVGGSGKQLLAAVKPWSFDEKQHLVRLLSTYLETEPLALDNINWIPKTLLEKSLSTLSFKIRRIGGASNLVDDPKIEYIPCDFVSLEYPGTRSEQWIFRGSDNKLYPVFGRDCIETIKLSTET